MLITSFNDSLCQVFYFAILPNPACSDPCTAKILDFSEDLLFFSIISMVSYLPVVQSHVLQILIEQRIISKLCKLPSSGNATQG